MSKSTKQSYRYAFYALLFIILAFQTHAQTDSYWVDQDLQIQLSTDSSSNPNSPLVGSVTGVLTQDTSNSTSGNSTSGNQSIICNYSNSTNCSLTQDQIIQIIIQLYITQFFPVFIDGNGLAILCPPACLLCTSGTQCLICLLGYALDANKACVPCVGCLTCNATTPAVCTACVFPLQINTTTNTCDVPIACTNSGCQVCSTATNCSACYAGYSLFNNDCVACTANGCNKCTANASQCDADGCALGYVYFSNSKTSSNQCLQCSAGCASCASTNVDSCIGCLDGYYPFLNNTKSPAGNSCVACLKNCKTCTSSSSCTKCFKGFKLTSDGLRCVSLCSSSCYTCVQNKPSQCLSCYGGYIYNSTTQSCQVDMSCNSTGTCTACSMRNVLVNSYCQACTLSDSNCNNCLPTNLTACSSCVSGYYLKSTSCVACPSICSTCFNENSCASCVDGYVLVSQAGQSTGMCSACSDPCQTCFMKPTICTSCASGFNLEGSRCLGQLNVEYTCKFNLVFNLWATIFQQFSLFIWGRCKLIRSGFRRQRMFTRRVWDGSAAVSGAVSPSSSSDAGLIGSSLSSSLASGSSVAGTPIISSSVTVNGASSSPNLGLILGVSIPLFLILVAVLIFIGIKLSKKEKYTEYEDVQGESMSNKEKNVKHNYL